MDIIILRVVITSLLVLLIIAGPLAAYLNQDSNIIDVKGKLNIWSLSLLKNANKSPSTQEISANLVVIYLFYLINDKLLIIGAVTYFLMFTANKIAIDKLENSPLIKSLTSKKGA